MSGTRLEPGTVTVPEKADHKYGCRYQKDNAWDRRGSRRPTLLSFLGTEPLCEGIQVLLHGSCEERVHQRQQQTCKRVLGFDLPAPVHPRTPACGFVRAVESATEGAVQD